MSDNKPQSLPDHVQANRTYWDDMAPQWIPAAKRSWASTEPFWGVWSLPESKVHMLPDDMSGMHAIELGCGTGYVSGWMTKFGARAVGIDNSEEQLKTASKMAHENGVEIDFMHGSAESIPLPDGSFDFAISEYGAAIWCDPHVWIPEAHRLLRPGGELVFLGSTPMASITTPPDGSMSSSTLHRDYFGLHKLDWRDVEVDPGGVEFNLPISEWISLFHRTGFEILEYMELQAPADMEANPFQSPSQWAKRWPYEQVWKLKKRD